jgi:DUF4097 and DUF4098 domain-containing protein YvlB
MRKNIFRIASAAAWGALLAACIGSAQDSKQTYPIAAGGHVLIRNVSGDIKIGSYDGSGIVVYGYRIGPDKDLVQIEDTSTADKVDLKVSYPQFHGGNASVNFEVKIPRGEEYNFDEIRSVSGNIEIADVNARIRVESVSGNVLIRNVAGLVSASSVSGDVNAEINQVQGAGDMKFASVSGNVNVRAPAGLNADVDMSTVSGMLKTDFPINIQERRYGPGRSARGRLGAGAHGMRMTSVSGKVSLIRN